MLTVCYVAGPQRSDPRSALDSCGASRRVSRVFHVPSQRLWNEYRGEFHPIRSGHERSTAKDTYDSKGSDTLRSLKRVLRPVGIDRHSSEVYNVSWQL